MLKLCDPVRSTPGRVALYAMCRAGTLLVKRSRGAFGLAAGVGGLLRLGLGGVPVVGLELDCSVELLLHPGLGLFRLAGLFDLGGTSGGGSGARLGQPAAGEHCAKDHGRGQQCGGSGHVRLPERAEVGGP